MLKTRTTHATPRRRRTPRSSRVCALLGVLAGGLVALGAPAWGQVINEDLKLLASDGEAGDLFGFSVAVGDGIIAVGALWDDDNGSKSGSVYLIDAATGEEIRKLVPADGQAGDNFGRSIAISNGIIVVGASRDDDNGTDSGSAYLYDIATGMELHKLLPGDGARDDLFGVSVALDGGIVVVSAHLDTVNGINSGSAYLFDAATGAQLHKLLPSDGTTNHHFSRSLAIDDDIVAVGAYGDASWSGAVYLFDAITGTEIAKLVADDRAQNDSLGYWVDIDSGIVAAGAFGDDDNGSQSGSAYLFDASTGEQCHKLLPDDGAQGDLFGETIAIDNGTVVVGALHSDENGTDSGSAYSFDAATGTQLAKLLASDGESTDLFGWPVAIDNGTIVVGAYQDDDNGSNAGAAYVFGIDCDADLTGDGVVDTLDFLLFLGAYASGDLIADWNGDGEIDTLDFLAFLNDWAAGC